MPVLIESPAAIYICAVEIIPAGKIMVMLQVWFTGLFLQPEL